MNRWASVGNYNDDGSTFGSLLEVQEPVLVHHYDFECPTVSRDVFTNSD